MTMVKAVALVVVAMADGKLYAHYSHTHCYLGHGGTPLDALDTPLVNVTSDECRDFCNRQSLCVGYSRKYDPNDWYSDYGDCYFRSNLTIAQCNLSRGWETSQQVAPPPRKGNILYHLFEPKYTGLADKDAGDFKGDAGFIFLTFYPWEKSNPEASMEHNIIEMSEVDVVAWGEYEECNAPGSWGQFVCPDNSSTYCCTTFGGNGSNIPVNHTAHSLPGVEVSHFSLGPEFGFPGYWYSFPAESENVTWTERLLRRISGKCLGDVWRREAGGCGNCTGDALDQCVADCIQDALCVNGSTRRLELIWDRVFANASECPDVPLPSAGEPFTDGLPSGSVVV